MGQARRGQRDLSNMPNLWACFWLDSHYGMVVQACYEYAKNFVTNPDERRSLAETSVGLFMEGWPLAEPTEVDTQTHLIQVAPEVFRYLASLEPSGSRRRTLLLEAVSTAEKARRLVANLWTRAVALMDRDETDQLRQHFLPNVYLFRSLDE